MKYLYNDPEDVRLFLDIFGSAWETAAELDHVLGAFLLLDNEKRVVADMNAARCFAIDGDSPDYERIKDILTVMSGCASDIETRLIPCGEGMTAGFVHIKVLEDLRSLHCGLAQQKDIADSAWKDPLCSIMMISVEGAFGSREMLDSCWFTAADTLLSALPEGSLMGRISESEFRVFLPSTVSDPEETAHMLCSRVRSCKLINRLGNVVSEEHPLTVSIGICGGDSLPAFKIHGSAYALYETVSDNTIEVMTFRHENYERGKEDYYSLVKLSHLIEDNLFIYHFQPIVDAHTGDIFAYEALMRSDPSIGYGPLEILDLAQKRGRLYDIELATIRNCLTELSENQNVFEERKLFINSIPSQLLKAEDFNNIVSDFGELLEKTVIEFTEHTDVSDDALDCMRGRLKRTRMGLAIDDYGTGYSNTANLMRYSPDFVKLDRSLIADIDQKPQMQSLVASIIDFVHSTGGMALAEGVETFGEIRTMINLSVDLLQGYYVSRPKPVLLNEISDTVREEIVKINLEAQGSIKRVYRTSDGDTLDLSKLALEKYTEILVEGGKVTLTGEKDRFVRLPVVVKQDAECEIFLHNVYIETDMDVNVITVSEGSRARIICEGESVFSRGSVAVAETGSLRISGLGSLSVLADSQNCFAIGNAHDAAFGSILIDMSGKLWISVNGVNGIGIGGGRNGSVEIVGGLIDITIASFYGVGIGSHEDTAKITLHDCAINVTANSTETVCIGSLKGRAEIDMHDISYTCVCTGNILCAIGALGKEPAVINMHNLNVTTDLRGRNLVNVGTCGSTAECRISRTQLNLYAEGSAVSGIGDRDGGGNVHMEDCDLSMTFLTGSCHLIGSPNGSHELIRVIKKISLNE